MCKAQNNEMYKNKKVAKKEQIKRKCKGFLFRTFYPSTFPLCIINAGVTQVPQEHCSPDQLNVPSLESHFGHEILPSRPCSSWIHSTGSIKYDWHTVEATGLILEMSVWIASVTLRVASRFRYSNELWPWPGVCVTTLTRATSARRHFLHLRGRWEALAKMVEGLGWMEEVEEGPAAEGRAPAFSGSAANVMSSMYPYTREGTERMLV